MKRILMALAIAGATSGGVALAQQTPPGHAPSGTEVKPNQKPGTSESGTQAAPEATVPETPPEAAPAPAMPAPEETAPQAAMPAEQAPAPEQAATHNRPMVTVQGEAGIQAFSGPLASSLRAGPAWGVDAKIKTNFPVGFELRYQGASNQLFGSGNFWNGPREARVLQNGGQALLNTSLTRPGSMVEPFVAGGIGVAYYNLSDPVPGYKSDTLGQVPVSAGVNFHLRPATGRTGALTLGLRGDYEWLFSNQFSPTNNQTEYGVFVKQGGDQYRGEVTLGGSF